MMHVMEACLNVSITTIPCSHIHDSPTAHVPMSTFPCPMSVPNHVPMFPLGQILVLQFWDTQKSRNV
jgi:hypothetical protein